MSLHMSSIAESNFNKTSFHESDVVQCTRQCSSIQTSSSFFFSLWSSRCLFIHPLLFWDGFIYILDSISTGIKILFSQNHHENSFPLYPSSPSLPPTDLLLSPKEIILEIRTSQLLLCHLVHFSFRYRLRFGSLWIYSFDEYSNQLCCSKWFPFVLTQFCLKHQTHIP